MDIVTHAGIGMIAGAPLASSQPELAIGIVAGSVLPDLDALGRVFGKRTFLHIHQTWSHAIPVQAVLSVIAGCIAHAVGIDGVMIAIGLFAGLVVHTLLDFTNTLGVTLLAPFSRRRFCREWVFFIDATVLALTFIAAGFTGWNLYTNGEVSARYAVAFFSILFIYIFGKALLRARVGTVASDAVSLIPSALYPWRFFGVTSGKGLAELFQVNAITRSRKSLRQHQVFDASYLPLLAGVPEFELMRGLSRAYHVVNVSRTDAGELILCRDLRTRNFGTSFGDLEVLLDPDKRVKQIHFHV
jgi:membrane-bound metal-dependent hydrolase YbcI (DUF457 family)